MELSIRKDIAHRAVRTDRESKIQEGTTLLQPANANDVQSVGNKFGKQVAAKFIEQIALHEFWV